MMSDPTNTVKDTLLVNSSSVVSDECTPTTDIDVRGEEINELKNNSEESTNSASFRQDPNFDASKLTSTDLPDIEIKEFDHASMEVEEPDGSNDKTESKSSGKRKRARNKSRSKPKLSPNWFVALQISNENVLKQLENVQDEIVNQDPRLKAACVPIVKSHLTLMVFHALDEQLSDLETLIEEAILEFRNGKHLEDHKISVQVQGLDHFKDQVVFANVDFPDDDDKQKFESLWNAIASRLLEKGFLCKRDANITEFKRHLTVLKMSRARHLRKMEPKLTKISSDFYLPMKDNHFGQDSFAKVQLLSMNNPVHPTTGYYFCQREFHLGLSDNCEKDSMDTSSSDPSQAEESREDSPQENFKISPTRKLEILSLSEQKAQVRQSVRDAILDSAANLKQNTADT